MVVTHGTDTLEETAFFLHLCLPAGLPVVLTGSMRHAEEVSWDGPGNLLDAAQVALSGRIRLHESSTRRAEDVVEELYRAVFGDPPSDRPDDEGDDGDSGGGAPGGA